MTDQNAPSAGSVFISYSRKDKEFVRRLNDSLDSNGIAAWVDWEGIPLSSDWMDEIARAIEGSDSFIFVISPDSLASKVCLQELELGLKYNKKLVPILHREPEMGKELHEKLAATNWVYLREDLDDFEATIPKLVESIQTDLGWVRQHTRLLQRATEWDRKNRNNSFLLQGADLEDAERWMIEAAAQPNREVISLQAEYISASRTAATKRQRNVLIGISAALVVSVVLGLFALFSRNEAVRQEGIAKDNAAIAIAKEEARATQQAIAEEQRAIAEENEARAVQSEIIAKAQRSAAEARIYQNQAGELDLSTLLAIDSWQRAPSFLAEDILRRNTSLIPVPVSQMAHKSRIWNIQLDPEGKTFVTASGDGTACVWNFEGKQRFCVEHDSAIYDAVFSRDGELLFTGDDSGKLVISDTNSGQRNKEYDFANTVWDLNTSPNGHWLSVARDDNTVSLIDLTDLEKAPYNIKRSSPVYTAVFSPDSAWLAIGESSGEVIIWNVPRRFFLKGPQHQDEVYVVAFSPDGRWVASGGADSTVRVAQALTGQEEHVLHHGDWVEDIAFSPDGSWFAVASDDNRVWVWQTETGAEKLRLRHDNFVQEVKVSADGQWIAATGFDQSVRIWDAVSGSQMMLVPLSARGSALAFNPAGTRLAIGDQEGRVSIWDTSYLLTRLNSIEFPEFVHEALFTPDGEWLVVNTDERLVWQFPSDQLLDAQTTQQGTKIISAEALTYDLEVSPDSTWVMAGETEKNRAILYNMETRSTALLQHSAKVLGVAFDPDNPRAATAGENGKIILWDLGSGERNAELQSSSAVYSVAIEPGGKRLVAGLRNRTILWDIQSEEKLTELPQPGNIRSVAYSDDGLLLASASDDGTIYVWDVAGAYDGEPVVLRLNGQPVSLDFSPGNRWLAAGGSNSFAYLWDLTTGEEVSRLPHSEGVTSVSFSSDGELLATVSRKVVQFWDVAALPLVPTSQLIDVACSHLTANLNESQWEIIFPGEEYRPICPNLQVVGQ